MLTLCKGDVRFQSASVVGDGEGGRWLHPALILNKYPAVTVSSDVQPNTTLSQFLFQWRHHLHATTMYVQQLIWTFATLFVHIRENSELCQHSLELEVELSRIKEQSIDHQSLLTTIAQDKETLSRYTWLCVQYKIYVYREYIKIIFMKALLRHPRNDMLSSMAFS